MGGILMALLNFLRTLFGAAKKKKYICQYPDHLSFDTLKELETHVADVHKGQTIPTNITWSR